MLYYEILRNQWLLATLGGGLVLLLSTVMSYMAIWRPRPGRDMDQSADSACGQSAGQAPAPSGAQAAGQAPCQPECQVPGGGRNEAAGMAHDPHCPPALTFLQALPAVLIMTYVAIAIFMAAYFADKIISPPNW